MKQLALDLGLAPAPTLEAFLPAGNEHAVQHLRAWLEHGGGENIYLWGPPGCGKTHLLRALHGALAARGEAAGWMPPRPLPRPSPLNGAPPSWTMCRHLMTHGSTRHSTGL